MATAGDDLPVSLLPGGGGVQVKVFTLGTGMVTTSPPPPHPLLSLITRPRPLEVIRHYY